jgi:acetyltransferase-like isoleucine patch superfamily enzyme
MIAKRIIQRMIFYSLKFPVIIISYFDSRLYMKFYTSLLKLRGMKVNGIPRFIHKSAKFDGFDHISISDRIVVSSNVIFLTHDYSYTTALISINEKPSTDIGVLREIIIGNNVFIGMNSLLLPGTKIGNNVIIGAGSVVRGAIPDYSLVAGNPATIIGDVRDYVLKVKRQNAEFRIDTK